MSHTLTQAFFERVRALKKENNMRHLNHLDLPKEKNLEIIIFQEGQSFSQHRRMTGISFVVFFLSSSLLQRKVSFLCRFSCCLTFILPPLSWLMRARACKSVHKVYTHCVCTCMRTSVKWPLTLCQIAVRRHWLHRFCRARFIDSVLCSPPPPQCVTSL